MRIRRNRKNLLLAVGVGALALTGSAVFTNQLAFSGHAAASNNQVLGDGGITYTANVDVTSVSYTVDSTNKYIDKVTFITAVDTSGETVAVSFNGNGTDSSSNCAATANTPTTPDTTWVCTMDGTELVSSVTETDILVTPAA